MKKIILSLISFMLIACVSIASVAQAASSASDELSTLLSNIHTLSADFKQSIYAAADSRKKPIQTSEGTMQLFRPGKFRWEVKQPNTQLLIADEHYLWIYDVDLSQATRQVMDKNKVSSPASLLSGSTADLESRFDVVHLGKDTEQSFKLTPKNKGDLFKWIELKFSGGKLVQMKLFDNLGSLSIFQFTEVQLNPNLSPSLFQFKAPKGVDVIRN